MFDCGRELFVPLGSHWMALHEIPQNSVGQHDLKDAETAGSTLDRASVSDQRLCGP